MHNEHCEPPSELCCYACTEFHHGLHLCGSVGVVTSHHDGSICVLAVPLEDRQDWTRIKA